MDETSSWISGIVPEDGLPAMTAGFADFVSLPAGGFNSLTRATRQGKQFLLKGLKEAYAGSVVYQQLLRKEFDILALLNHSAVVQAVGWENVPGLGWCIVEEYVDGLTLTDFLDTRPTRQERRKVADELIEALRYVHSKQVVHRDLKPANILVTTNGHNVKIIDFGLSDTEAWTILKQPAGTRDYISPEQLYSGSPDCRNDIYSLGVVLRQMRAGWAYDAVARRCLRDAGHRYPHTTALAADLAALSKRARLLRTAATVLIPLLLIAGTLHVYYGVRERSLLALFSTEQARLTQHNDSLRQARERVPSAQAGSAETPLSARSVPVQSVQSANPGAQRDDLNHWIAEGLRTVDERYRGIEHYMDTLSRIENYSVEKTYPLLLEGNTISEDFKKRMETRLSAADASIVASALYAYMNEKGQRVQEKREQMEKAAR